KLTPDGLTQTASVFLETSMPTHDDMARFSYARDESTLASPRLCISRGDSINCSGFGPEANGWLLRLPPVLETLHGFSMPPIALTPMLDKLADTSRGTIRVALSRKGNQGVRYDERVSPRRRASMYWVRSLALSLALATLSR